MRALGVPAAQWGAVPGAASTPAAHLHSPATHQRLHSNHANAAEHRLEVHESAAVARRVDAHAAAAAAPAVDDPPRVTGTRRPRITPQRSHPSAVMPWSHLHAEVQAAVARRQLLPRGAHVLVAVSGGQDSLCLAQLLLDLAPHLQVTLTVAHCDHRMRPDSAGCAAYVRGWAAARGLPYCEAVADRPLKSEAQAREWRYTQLAALARAHGCTQVATGHTASDRAETLLLNLARGAGADGLAAMSWRRPLEFSTSSDSSDSEESRGADGSSSDGGESSKGMTGGGIELVRPMLTVSREQTAEECMRRGMQPWEDPTNADTRFSRNAVRLTVLPALRAINPAAVAHLAALAEMLSADVECLEGTAAAALQGAAAIGAGAATLVIKSGSSSSDTAAEPLDRAALRSQHVALQRRALRQWLRCGLGAAPTFDQVEEARRLLVAPNRSRGSTLRRGAWVQVEGPLLVLERSDSSDGSDTACDSSNPRTETRRRQAPTKQHGKPQTIAAR